jgi:hypothetical protein
MQLTIVVNTDYEIRIDYPKRGNDPKEIVRDLSAFATMNVYDPRPAMGVQANHVVW